MDNKQAFDVLKNNSKFTVEPDGQKYTICVECGKQNEQWLIPSQNRYTSFSMCPQCRADRKKKFVANKDNENETVITLDFKPHSKGQEEMYYDKHRFNVYNCGSRYGKDRVSIFKLIAYVIECLNEDRPSSMVPAVHAWLLAPVEKMAKQNWRELKEYMPRQLIDSVQNGEMTMQLKGGGLIEVRSSFEPEDLVGVGLDAALITEAARVKKLEEVWANIEQRLDSDGRGLKGEGGIGIINSSPLGKNFFYKMWTWGQEWHDNYDSNWKSWTFTRWDNPANAIKGNKIIEGKNGKKMTVKESMKTRFGKRRYAQDIMAEFLGGTNVCFPDFNENCVKKKPDNLTDEQFLDYIKDWQEPIPYREYRIGYDPASINDEPPLVIKEANGKRIVKLVNMAGKSWNSQYDTIAYYSGIYNNAKCIFSKTGHETIEEELVKRGVTVETVNEQGANKENMIINLEGIVQIGDIEVLDDGSDEAQSYINQMNDYSCIQRGTRFEYKNIEQPHDDWVSATYVVCYPSNSSDKTLPLVGILENISGTTSRIRDSMLW